MESLRKKEKEEEEEERKSPTQKRKVERWLPGAGVGDTGKDWEKDTDFSNKMSQV